MKAAKPVAFVLASTAHGSMLVNRFDYHEYQPGRAYGVGQQLLAFSRFEPQEVELVLKLLQARKQCHGPGVLAVDCGANIGIHTIEWAKLMTGWGEVLAFEAQERIFYALAGNITLNNCFNARAIWAALGETAGEIGVPLPNYTQPSSFGSLEIRQNAKTEFIGQKIDYNHLVKTRMMSLDELNLARLDLVKIDVEGMEIDVLNGAQQTLRKFRPIMVIEKIKSDVAQLEALLESWGYVLWTVGINFLAVHTTDPVRQQFSVQTQKNPMQP